MLDLSEFQLHDIMRLDNGDDVIVDRMLYLYKRDDIVRIRCDTFDITKVCKDVVNVVTNIPVEVFDEEFNSDSPTVKTSDGEYKCTAGKSDKYDIICLPYLQYTSEDDYWSHWEKVYLLAKKCGGEEVAKKILTDEESRWGDFLWLGRHLALVDGGFFDKAKTPEEAEFNKLAVQEGEAMVKRYKDCADHDFVMCFEYPSSENGDDEWEHICNNVGTLREFLWGEWNLDS